MLATELYLTLIYRPQPSKATSLFQRVTTRSREEIASDEKNMHGYHG